MKIIAVFGFYKISERFFERAIMTAASFSQFDTVFKALAFVVIYDSVLNKNRLHCIAPVKIFAFLFILSYLLKIAKFVCVILIVILCHKDD